MTVYFENSFWRNKNTFKFRFQRVVHADVTDVNSLLFTERT